MKTGQISKLVFGLSLSIAAIKSMNIGFFIFAIIIAVIAFQVWGGRSRDILKFSKYLIWIGLFVFLLHLFGHKGEHLFKIWFVTATVEGAIIGSNYLLKLMVFGISALIILKTVDPFELIQPIEKLAKKLGNSGKLIAKGALAFSLALRFIPDIIKQAKLTLLALKSRGIDFEGGLSNKASTASMLTATLFVAAFKKSEQTALSLSVKGYPGRYSKAILPESRFMRGSFITIIISIVILIHGWKS